MIVKKINTNIYILRIEPDEELFTSLLDFAKKYKIKSGFFYGIGACKNCILGRYNEKKKGYDWKNINKQTEISSLIGNLTNKEGHHYLHIHGVITDSKFQTLSGHFQKAVISPTCEIMFFAFDKKIERKYNELTNLFLID